jgi:predicted ester cyclase
LSLEENKATIRRYTKACNERNVTLLKEMISPDYFHSALQLRSWKEYIEFETMLWKAFPDLHETNEDIIAEGDKGCYRLKFTGTHKGEWLGLAPTGKKVTLKAVQIWRLVNGKVVKKDSIGDLLDIFKQLGVIEYTEKAKDFSLLDNS